MGHEIEHGLELGLGRYRAREAQYTKRKKRMQAYRQIGRRIGFGGRALHIPPLVLPETFFTRVLTSLFTFSLQFLSA